MTKASFRITAMGSAALLLLCASSAFAKHAKQKQQTSTTPASLTYTTSSPEAARLAQNAVKLYLDQVQQVEAIKMLRKAVALDPDFAMGHELLAQISLDSSEQVREQAKAFTEREDASASEREIIEWYQDACDHKLMFAITKMNDLLSQYPHDKTIVWMTTWWLMTQSQYDRAIAVYETSGITDSPGLMNNMGYNYAYVHSYNKAFAMMDKYVAALPNESNPQDSYAEILRLAGRFEQSVEHYRASLAIDPSFYSSQFGIADTYSLMGDQARARREYEAGFHKFSLQEQQDTLWRTREAETFIRESDFDWADRAFQAIADNAHTHHLSLPEADTYRQMAIYQPDPARTLELLSKADAAVAAGENSNKTALQQEAAQILRARVELAIKMDNHKIAAASLDTLAAMSDEANDSLIDFAYHGAAGAMFVWDGKYHDAIAQLEQDMNNPLSLKLLITAYQKTGDKSAAAHATELLSNLNDPTVEQALVVPSFRKCAQDPACNGSVKSAGNVVPHTL
ncbi:MAG: hypothetical protein ABSE92_04735 [Terriglobales bacterium]